MAIFKTRLSAMDALDCKSARDSPDELLDVARRRDRVDELHPDFALDKEAAKGRAQR